MQEIILKIEELRQIEPEKKWVQATKSEILGQKQISQKVSELFGWLPKRAFFVLPTAMALVLFCVSQYNKNVRYTQMASVDLEVLEMIANNLRQVESDFIRTSDGLENISQADKMLRIQDLVVSALESGGKIVENTREMVGESEAVKRTPQVYSIINEVEYATDNLEYALEDMDETYLTKQKELARNMIEELDELSLTEEQLSVLEQAKNAFNEARYSEALMKIFELSQR